MTTPDERTRALQQARDLLIELAYGNRQLVRRALRDEAVTILRHFPYSEALPPANRER
ncbi:BPSL0761 family protein [Paraburkholderia sp. RL17-337-BIB-A]|uniref:BPSL0761 family protein n=1 Tax=Paraburkholderia sp. RL17-337-BIB-A TaxID=3031636 RepID=UPI0038BC9933